MRRLRRSTEAAILAPPADGCRLGCGAASTGGVVGASTPPFASSVTATCASCRHRRVEADDVAGRPPSNVPARQRRRRLRSPSLVGLAGRRGRRAWKRRAPRSPWSATTSGPSRALTAAACRAAGRRGSTPTAAACVRRSIERGASSPRCPSAERDDRRGRGDRGQRVRPGASADAAARRSPRSARACVEDPRRAARRAAPATRPRRRARPRCPASCASSSRQRSHVARCSSYSRALALRRARRARSAAVRSWMRRRLHVRLSGLVAAARAAARGR